MLKLLKKVILILLVIGTVYILFVVRDRKTLREQIIRLHVVADSNSQEDQSIKEMVRDAILEKLEALTANAQTKDEAEQILSDNLLTLQQIANDVLVNMGVSSQANVTLQQEAFPTREYDTFTLPAGVYDSLRVVIGEGEGKNWWCVVFPGLCIPAASEEVEDVATSAGFSNGLGKSLTGEKGYEIRFFLLDTLGRLENFFFNH